MRRRNKPRVVWLPPTGANSIDAAGQSCWNFVSVALPTPDSAGATGVIEVPIVQDGTPSDPLNATSSLADIELSGYRLRRIVGKLYVFIGQTSNTADNEDIYGVTAGLIIRRTDPSSGGSLAAAASAATNFTEIDPGEITNSMDPWIWRRSWLLSNGPFPTTPSGNLTNGVFVGGIHRGPATNYGAQYPGPTEGPHIDQKTARIVGPEERLFLDISAQNILGGSASPTSLVIIYEFRVLASMRANIGNRRNAVR